MERAGRLIGKMKLSPTLVDPESRACAAWRVAAGKKVAEHTRAKALVRGALIVEVEDLVWQRQLNTVRHFLLRNLREILGEETVTEIDFRPMPRRMAPQRAEAARSEALRFEDGIQDPVMSLLYRESQRASKKRESA
jgi:predicted nucleic acid-binding Zn ribbon protein